MLGALIVVFREVIEAGLIIGIALAVTRGVPGTRRVIVAGAVAGLLGALIVAAFAEQLSGALAGRGQELFNAGVLGFAVLMLAWHNIWMARHGRELARELSAVGHSVKTGEKGFVALAMVVGVAVLREGAEVALFLYGILVSGESTANLLTGGVIGLALGAGLSFLTFYGLVKIPPGKLFGATAVLVTLLAAGLASQCAAFLQQAGLAPVLTQTLWDTSAILPDNGVVGRVLRTLIGYADQPSALQGVVYLATIAVIVLATRLAATLPTAPKPVRAAPAE
ncbi:FTR1 family iron permease [Methylocystis bryophila]|uniref:Iron permease n=1 Tax=Methylocystis bryophila TaxID=655015 RepID=A0A1W6MVY8_9HYPH|nr:FTR1 family protein [Methylocystis bryophila]ARN81763.1 iron permease [Methylocystis bryophila]BDV37821.1 transport-related membrane protein [Methylocystis bryophila]